MTMPTITAEHLILEEDIPGGAMWSIVLARHHTLRFTDVNGSANVSLLLYNRDQLLERYNMADTLKAQHTAFVTTGNVLYSDMGRILCSVSADSCGWHDTVCGANDAAIVKAKYGEKNYQTARNERHMNGRDCLLTELAKWGLGLRDLVPNLNLFSKVVADDGGKLQYVVGHSRAGASVDLRAEMNVLVVLSTCQHPLDPNTTYAPGAVRATLYRNDAPAADDVCRTSCPENERGFYNTERMFRMEAASALRGDRMAPP